MPAQRRRDSPESRNLYRRQGHLLDHLRAAVRLGGPLFSLADKLRPMAAAEQLVQLFRQQHVSSFAASMR